MARDVECHLTQEPQDWAELARGVPHQAQQVLISWVFIVASLMLFLDFASLQQLVALGPEASYFAKLNNWFGVVSCVHWLLGFVILVHWLARIGGTKGALAGAGLKVVASVLFNLQPMTGTAGTAGGAGLWWSNFAGILCFHIGNIVSCADFYVSPPPMFDRRKSFAHHGNLPVTGMWIYQLATWLLVGSNFLACNWGGAIEPKSILPMGHWVVAMCQYFGAGLLFVGSCVYCAWCDGFRTCAV